jgi:hypothetical protein
MEGRGGGEAQGVANPKKIKIKVYLQNLTDCVTRQKIGLILSVKIVPYNTFRCHTYSFQQCLSDCVNTP